MPVWVAERTYLKCQAAAADMREDGFYGTEGYWSLGHVQCLLLKLVSCLQYIAHSTDRRKKSLQIHGAIETIKSLTDQKSVPH